MKFSSFKEFRGSLAASPQDVIDYLNIDLTKIIRELNIGLTRLTFDDNFESFVTTVTIAAGAEIAIRNGLKNGAVPRYRVILRGDAGSKDVVDGDAEWNRDFVSLQNVGASPATLTVAFIR